MRRFLSLFAIATSALFSFAQAEEQGAIKPDPNVMSQKYYEYWNDDVQKEIDERIEKYRKADCEFQLQQVKKGSTIKIEQIASDFLFGANFFNYDQLGSNEMNEKYKNLYGTLFNQATIAFYWDPLEPVQGELRFEPKDEDSAEFWNKCEEPEKNPRWRRPPTDPLVEHCQRRGVQTTGHTIIWGNRNGHHPKWLSVDETNVDEMERLCKKRIRELAERYQDRITRWDVVNESSVDFGKKGTKSAYGVMPEDYAFKSFITADEAFPKSVELNINDYNSMDAYVPQILDLQKRGARIDNMGIQMHLFNPADTLGIAEGKEIQTPDVQKARLTAADKAGLPLILSEITITAPNDDKKGRDIQAIVTRNLYRYWFSWPTMRSIVWWNVVDDCGWAGEPTTSGLFTRQMEPKPSYYALENLILNEWRTKLQVEADSESPTIKFRGFKGKYRVAYLDSNGNEKVSEIELK